MADDGDFRGGTRGDFGNDAIDCALGGRVQFVSTLHEVNEIRRRLLGQCRQSLAKRFFHALWVDGRCPHRFRIAEAGLDIGLVHKHRFATVERPHHDRADVPVAFLGQDHHGDDGAGTTGRLLRACTEKREPQNADQESAAHQPITRRQKISLAELHVHISCPEFANHGHRDPLPFRSCTADQRAAASVTSTRRSGCRHSIRFRP